MTAKLTEIADGGEKPNTPSIAEMRESQPMGNIGKGTQSEAYAQMQADFNMGTGEAGDGDKPSFQRWSNDAEINNRV